MLTSSPVSKADKLANDVKSSSPVSARSVIWESNQTSIVKQTSSSLSTAIHQQWGLTHDTRLVMPAVNT